jgi:hypothetical protein
MEEENARTAERRGGREADLERKHTLQVGDGRSAELERARLAGSAGQKQGEAAQVELEVSGRRLPDF